MDVNKFVSGLLSEASTPGVHPPAQRCQRIGCEATATRYVTLDNKLWLCPACFAAVAKGEFTVAAGTIPAVAPRVVAAPKLSQAELIREGQRLGAIAGHPAKDDLILVYGSKGPAMSWTARAAFGVPAEQFQDALAKKKALLSVSGAAG
jgi:hypothetical protein